MQQPTPTPRARVISPVSGVSNTCLYQAVQPSPTGGSEELVEGPRVAIIARMHGNEPVGEPVLHRLAEHVGTELIAGSVLAVLANEEATALDERHTPTGSDLNRMWDRATLARLAARDPSGLSYEESRALQLAPLLLACDAVLDLHSTSRPAASFLVFRDDQRHAAVARRLGVERLVTGLHENAILSGGVASNVGLGPGEPGPRLGFTFEAGQHTDPGNAVRAWSVTTRFLTQMGIWRRGEDERDAVSGQVYEVVDRFRQAPAANPYRFVGYPGGEPGGGRRAPPRQLHSFEEVEADEIILRRGRSEVVRAHTPFTMLMPAPDTAPDTDLYYVTQPRHGGLSEGNDRTDLEARREALAIERMLDLLADDEFERGSTWAAFDSTRIFDLCASIVGRSSRLPHDHPHRRIVVMGRGDVAGDETERRAGQRYRQAMRYAIASGLPMERIQLLRGAPLAWIDALTSHGMLGLLHRRAAVGGGGVHMRVSLRQPHTASLLVAGDLQHALNTGDTRHVRVAILIEAATVEPDGPTARVRVVRSALVSSRAEVLNAAHQLLEGLRREHKYQLRHGALRAESALHELLTDDLAIETRADPMALEALRGALLRTQARMWCDQLLHEITGPIHLEDDVALGRWLAQVMASTGILDAEALRALAVRRDGSGWVAEPDTIERLYQRVDAPTDIDAPPILMFGPTVPPSPAKPLLAGDVTADTLERWVGWKRFVRGGQSIPDVRGQDLDLAFSSAVVRRTLARWFDGARALAAHHPGDVMVVVAGDGLNPTRDRLSDAFALFQAHRRCVLDPHVHYLRIQHAQGTYLSWMKDFLGALHRRPPEGHSVSIQFEVEHGATVNVVLVLQRAVGQPATSRPWSLDDWDIRSCGVLLSDLETHGSDSHQVGLFTDGRVGSIEGRVEADHPVNQELLHFGRAHCEGLLVQAGARVRAERGALSTEAFERCLVDQIARWIERVRVWQHSSQSAPRDVEARGRWVARRLGLADARLARALAREMERDTPAVVAAASLWESVPPWPGPAAGG